MDCCSHAASEAGQERGNKTSPVRVTNSDELKITIAYVREKQKAICCSQGNTDKLCKNLHNSKINVSYIHVAFQTEVTVWRTAHIINISLSPTYS